MYKLVTVYNSTLTGRSNVIEPHILDARNKSTILSSPINSTLHTVIIAHGFTEDADLSPWMKAIKEHFLLKVCKIL